MLGLELRQQVDRAPNLLPGGVDPIERGYYVAQRGMINLSLPVQESDLVGFVQATREYLIRHAPLLPRSTAK